ncbi:hypothetical protein LCGC14_0310850 [marine sediment metagenome]|uniref:SprT-like domain-containing protein n=1 Tax=marine sediment metagenome TaxID=412755 RepID=A0A0F9U4T7_9ZZZZ
MTDAKRARRVRPIIDSWAEFLGISHTWEIKFGFTDELGSVISGGEAAATIAFQHPYRQAIIQFSRTQVDRFSNDDLESCILHELIHIIVEEVNGPIKVLIGDDGSVYSELHNHIESLVDALTRIILRIDTAKGRKGVKFGSY